MRHVRSALTVKSTVECSECNDEAEYAHCQKHLDQELKDAFDQGHKEGYDEGFQEGSQSLTKE